MAKRIIMILVVVAGMFNTSFAQQLLNRQWTSFHNGALNGFDNSKALVVDANGNVFVTGQSFENSTNGSITTVMYDPAGTMQWTDNYKGNVTTVQNKGEAICLDPFGNVLVTGTVALNDGDFSILKYNNSGILWAKNKEPYSWGSGIDYAKEIATDALGNIYCVASIQSLAGNLQDTYTLKCDSAGSNTWDVIYGGSDDDWAEGLAVTPDGHCFSITSSYNFFGSATYDMQTIHYDSASTQQWISSYHFQSVQSEDYPVDIKCDAAYNTWVCGAADVGATTDMACYKQNVYGTRLWVVTYNGTANGNDTAVAISYLPNNLAVVTGRTKELVNGITQDAITTMLIDSGTVLWTRHFYGDSLNAMPTAMTTDANGNIYICGYYQTTSGSNAVTLVYNQAGNLIFMDAYDGVAALSNRFNDIYVDAAGIIYVTGQTYTAAGNADYVTIKYGAITAVNDFTGTENFDVIIYPNPASDHVSILINGKEEAIAITFYDMKGKKVYEDRHNQLTGPLSLDIGHLKKGIYVLNVVSKTRSAYQKLVLH